MLISRRTILATTLAAVSAPALAADDYPTKPIRLIVGYPPGGTTDFAARVIAEAMTKRLGQTVIVESRPGADSMIADDYVAKATPDGYALVFANADSTSMLLAEKAKVPYQIPESFSYISRVVQIDYVLVVNAKLPINSVADLVAYAKANPGKVRYGTAGVGSAGHVTCLLLEQAGGIKMIHVPYRGSAPAMTDTAAGFVDFGFQSLATVGDMANVGKVRIIAVTADKRDPAVPNAPTMKEAGYPSVGVTNWLGILGPAKLPPNVLAKLRTAVSEALADPTVQQQYAKLGLTPSPLVGDAFQKLMVDELEAFKKVTAAAHLVIE